MTTPEFEQNYSPPLQVGDLGPMTNSPKSHRKSHPRIIQEVLRNPIFDTKNGSFYSVDMVRFKLKSNPRKFEEVQKVFDTYPAADGMATYTSNRIGSYRFMWVYHYEESSVKVGYGLIEGSGKTNAGEGFLEYNPNKVGEQGERLYSKLLEKHVRCNPVRFDIAIDFPLQRDTVRICKDQRKYGCEISAAFTEYLGQRNKPGRVKLYDKQAEAGLDLPWTRIELTCDANWGVDEILSNLPVVFSFNSDEFEGMSGTTKLAALLIRNSLEHGDVIEPWLRLVDPKTKAKMRRAFQSEIALEYSRECIEKIKTKAF